MACPSNQVRVWATLPSSVPTVHLSTPRVLGPSPLPPPTPGTVDMGPSIPTDPPLPHPDPPQGPRPLSGDESSLVESPWVRRAATLLRRRLRSSGPRLEVRVGRNRGGSPGLWTSVGRTVRLAVVPPLDAPTPSRSHTHTPFPHVWSPHTTGPTRGREVTPPPEELFFLYGTLSLLVSGGWGFGVAVESPTRGPAVDLWFVPEVGRTVQVRSARGG